MTKAAVGERVRVDIDGLQTPGVPAGTGKSCTGVVTAVDLDHGLITVRLEASFTGADTVTVPTNRVIRLPEARQSG